MKLGMEVQPTGIKTTSVAHTRLTSFSRERGWLKTVKAKTRTSLQKEMLSYNQTNHGTSKELTVMG